jgi:multidrug transporter EmrE-like cation transporter
MIYAPAAAWAIARYGFPVSNFTLVCIAASGVLHLAYSLVLQRGYQVADLSVVYPIARGTGPMLSAIGAFTLLDERVTLAALAGLAAVVAGILMLDRRAVGAAGRA